MKAQALVRTASTFIVCLIAPSLGAAPPDNQQHVASILVQRCLACHGPSKQEGGYRVDSFERLRKAGDSGAKPIVPGHADQSELHKRLTTTDSDLRMPAGAPALSNEQIAAFEKWINAGAQIEADLEAKPIASWARPARQALTPEHYPNALPITALALSVTESESVVWTSGYGETLQWKLDEAEPKLAQRLPVAGLHVSDLDCRAEAGVLAIASGTPGTQGFVELFARRDSEFQLIWSHACADLPADLALSPDGQQLAIGHSDGTLQIVTLADKQTGDLASRVMSPHADAILAVNWSANGDRLITGSRDRTAKIFDTGRWQLIANYDRHERAVGGVAYLGHYPVSLDETGKLRLWSGDDSDRTLAERDNQARFLERIVASQDRVWLAMGPKLRSFEIERKTVDDGKDEAGKPKQKTTTRWKAFEDLESQNSGWLLSADANAELVAAGNESGQVIVWRRGEKLPWKTLVARP